MLLLHVRPGLKQKKRNILENGKPKVAGVGTNPIGKSWDAKNKVYKKSVCLRVAYGVCATKAKGKW